MWILALLACEPEGPALSWSVAPTELGDPVEEGEGFDPADGDALGAAFPELLPGYGETFPVADVPLAIWGIAMHELVADAGICPYKELDGAITTYQSHCRSKHGYEWEGTVRIETSEADGLQQVRYDFDLEVKADVESPRFEELSLEGALVVAEGGEVDHVDVNLMAELLGYYEARQQADDPRIQTWADWRAAGSVETDDGGLRVDLAAAVGDSDGFQLRSEQMRVDPGCPIEPTGEAWMSDHVTARFQGAEACDACAAIDDDGATVDACAP